MPTEVALPGNLSSAEFNEVADSLARRVWVFGPERILSAEIRSQIVESILNGLDTIASQIKIQVDEGDSSAEEITPTMRWSINDLVRTALTNPPLSVQEFQLEGTESAELLIEASVADSINWWAQLSEEQKRALWLILKEDFGIDIESKTEEVAGFPGYAVVKSTRVMTVPAAGDWSENKFRPALFTPAVGEGSQYLSCYIIEGEG